jgi:hypothetical protein
MAFSGTLGFPNWSNGLGPGCNQERQEPLPELPVAEDRLRLEGLRPRPQPAEPAEELRDNPPGNVHGIPHPERCQMHYHAGAPVPVPLERAGAQTARLAVGQVALEPRLEVELQVVSTNRRREGHVLAHAASPAGARSSKLNRRSPISRSQSPSRSTSTPRMRSGRKTRVRHGGGMRA